MNILFDLYGTLADIRTDEHSPAFWERLARGGAGFTREEYLACCARHAARLPADGEIDLALVFAELTGYSDSFQRFCAAAVVVSLPITILFFLLQRYYVEGVTGGSVKG